MPGARLHDGSVIDVEVHGDGPTVLLPVNPQPIEGPQADVMREWGADPALGRSLVMGGFPPIDGPYAEMLRVTEATHEMSTVAQRAPATPSTPATAQTSSEEFDWSSVEVTMSEPQTRQFMTLYQALEEFDDRAAQAHIACPRLCFAGSADEIDYDERWGGVRVGFVTPLVNRRAELEASGWDVRVLDGLDHTQAMQAADVLGILRPWLTSKLRVG